MCRESIFVFFVLFLEGKLFLFYVMYMCLLLLGIMVVGGVFYVGVGRIGVFCIGV